jgi:hypothetical protein
MKISSSKWIKLWLESCIFHEPLLFLFSSPGKISYDFGQISMASLV